jgi:hypothetical protein
MIKIPAEYEREISSAKFTAMSRQVSPDSQLGISVGICQRALVDESGFLSQDDTYLIDQEIPTVTESENSFRNSFLS